MAENQRGAELAKEAAAKIEQTCVTAGFNEYAFDLDESTCIIQRTLDAARQEALEEAAKQIDGIGLAGFFAEKIRALATVQGRGLTR